METITKYRTSDGNEYDDKTTAEAHERDLEREKTRASMPWIDRRLARIRDEYDRFLTIAARCHSNLDGDYAKIGNMLEPVMKCKVESSGHAWVETLCDRTCSLHDVAAVFDKSVATLADALVKMYKLSRRIDLIEDNRERLFRDNEDVDGTCQWEEGYGHVCGASTVEGTCWCKNHIDQWCERHARHALGKRSAGAYTWYPYCEECRN